MDLERIKQNLRLRSGRLKKLRKAPNPPRPAQTSQHTQTDAESQSDSNDDFAHTPVVIEGKGSTDENMPQPQEQQEVIAPPQISKTDSASLDQRRTVNNTDMEEDESQRLGSSSARPQTLTRRSTRDSNQSISQKPTPQLLSSLMADSSSSESNSSDDNDYDLRPPAPRPKPPSVESISGLLFSAGHLNTVLHNQSLLARFTSFLHRYRPEDYPLLMRYLETSKAVAAVEYANAVVLSATDLLTDGSKTKSAASLNEAFQTSFNAAFEALLNDCLPLYITYSLVKSVSECLQNEIMGKNAPAMRGLVGGLSEVFCLTDPQQPDNPIIYASEEFYRYTGFGRDDVIGHNCRFLQGAKTQANSPKRLKISLDKGEEVCETLLNYRRDGRPFINLLMIAPLHDDKGNVKYHIGAQVDVSGLVESGHGLQGFQRFREKQKDDDRQDECRAIRREADDEAKRKQKALAKLRDLSELFDLEESAVVVSHSRSASAEREDERPSLGSRQKTSRTFLVDTDHSDDEDERDNGGEERHAWELAQAGPERLSGKLPGVYEKYLLIRPAPSLRIIFVSHRLQSYGKFVQNPFLSHIAAPLPTLRGLAENLKAGTPVSAKINLMPGRGEAREGTRMNPGARHEDGKYGRACWMSATPLLGSDDQVGVWMIVIVERLKGRDQAERYATRPQGVFGRSLSESEHFELAKRLSRQHSRSKAQDLPIKPIRIDSGGETHALSRRRHMPIATHNERSFKSDVSLSAPDGTSGQRVNARGGSRSRLEGRPSPTRAMSDASVPSSRRVYGSDSEDEDENVEAGGRESEARVRSSATDYLPANISPSVPFETQSPASGQTDSKIPTRSTFANRTADLPPVVSSSGSTRSKSSTKQSPKKQSPRTQSPLKQSPRKQSVSPASEKDVKRKTTGRENIVYMDYLSHPSTSRNVERGRPTLPNNTEGSDGAIDLDCIRSPYSVD